MAFPYYDRLNRRDQATYRASDRITTVELTGRTALKKLARAVRKPLAAGDRAQTQAASLALVRALMEGLDVPAVTVRVLAVRPRYAESELHGLYEHEDGRRAVIRVWMRTAAKKQPVAYRTFLRTLLHEVCHHLDYQLFELEESFHTEGFFRRESSLMRQLTPPLARKAPARKAKPKPKRPKKRPRLRRSKQLTLL